MSSLSLLETHSPMDASQLRPDHAYTEALNTFMTSNAIAKPLDEGEQLLLHQSFRMQTPFLSEPPPPLPPLPLGEPAALALPVPGPPQAKKQLAEDLRECPFQSGRGQANNAKDLSDDYIRQMLQVEVSHESCNMIRTINGKLLQMVGEGVCRYVRAEDNDNCVWGFRVLEVENPAKFNSAFRAIVQPGRDNMPLKRPTEVFMKTLRFCGVTARRGARGPRETDPDPRDFMYSYYYDFVSSKEEYNRRKLCTNGYSKEAREIAGKHKGEFLESDLMPRRTKRATEMRAATAAAVAAATPPTGLDALFEIAVSELKSEEKAKRDKALRELAARESKKQRQPQHVIMEAQEKKAYIEPIEPMYVPVADSIHFLATGAIHVPGNGTMHVPVAGGMHVPALGGVYVPVYGGMHVPAVSYGEDMGGMKPDEPFVHL